ncbi:hypothetical protein DFH09DRAFT_1361611 [Mycena vulgaris]|nr:hypothetical protein DFH09DRAFT_1361611 [Mycena vulgaris]
MRATAPRTPHPSHTVSSRPHILHPPDLPIFVPRPSTCGAAPPAPQAQAPTATADVGTHPSESRVGTRRSAGIRRGRHRPPYTCSMSRSARRMSDVTMRPPPRIDAHRRTPATTQVRQQFVHETRGTGGTPYYSSRLRARGIADARSRHAARARTDAEARSIPRTQAFAIRGADSEAWREASVRAPLASRSRAPLTTSVALGRFRVRRATWAHGGLMQGTNRVHESRHGERAGTDSESAAASERTRTARAGRRALVPLILLFPHFISVITSALGPPVSKRLQAHEDDLLPALIPSPSLPSILL